MTSLEATLDLHTEHPTRTPTLNQLSVCLNVLQQHSLFAILPVQQTGKIRGIHANSFPPATIHSPWYC